MANIIQLNTSWLAEMTNAHLIINHWGQVV